MAKRFLAAVLLVVLMAGGASAAEKLKVWFDAGGSMVRHFSDGTDDAPLHWRDPQLTFNTACFGCHVSQIAKNYDLSSDSIFAVDGSLEMLSTLLAGVPVTFDFEQTNGEKNQTKVKTLVSGKVLLNDASFKATNKQRATASFQGQGVGPLSINGVEVGTVPPSTGG